VFNRAQRVGDRDDQPLRRLPEMKRPGRVRPEPEALDVDEIERLAEGAAARTRHINGELGEMAAQRDRLTVLLMGFCGLRAEEVGGLRREDVLPDCRIQVTQQVTEHGVTRLKTRESRRTMTIDCGVHEELLRFIERFGTAADGRIIRGPNGELRDHIDTNNALRRAARRAGMTGVHPHLLRHSAASLLIREGANPREVQNFLGHADVTLTLQTYGHLFDKAGGNLAAIIGRLREQNRNGADESER